jgi:hypothetical protein
MCSLPCVVRTKTPLPTPSGSLHRDFLETLRALPLALVALSGCGGADETFVAETPNETPAALPPSEPPTASPVYVLTSNVWGESGATGYLYTVRSLAAGEATLQSAIELPGGAWLSGRDGDRFVYVSSGDAGPTITRWEVMPDGGLMAGPRVSFANLGLTQGMRFGTAPIATDTLAYLLDPAQLRVATWNPADMSVGTSVDLDLEARAGLPAWLPTIVVRGDRVLLTAVWEEDYRFGDVSRIITIDGATQRVIEQSDERRCEQLAVSSSASDGTAYYSPYAHSAAARAVLGPGFGTRSCGLRVVPPGLGFEQGWEVDLAALAGGRPAGEFVLASDGVGFFRAYYADEIGVTAETWQDELGTPAYRWWRWEIGASDADEVPGQALTVEAAHYVVDGKVYIGNPSGDWSRTTIVELSSSGELLAGLNVPGTPGGIVRAR